MWVALEGDVDFTQRSLSFLSITRVWMRRVNTKSNAHSLTWVCEGIISVSLSWVYLEWRKRIQPFEYLAVCTDYCTNIDLFRKFYYKVTGYKSGRHTNYYITVENESLKVLHLHKHAQYNRARLLENLFLSYANNKSAFVVRCLDSIISLVSISEISSP